MPTAHVTLSKAIALHIILQDTISLNCGPKNVTFPLAGSLSKDITRPGNLKEGAVATLTAFQCKSGENSLRYSVWPD
jgi:hypothetical protein